LRQLRDRPQLPERRQLLPRSLWAWWRRTTQRSVAAAPPSAFERWYAETEPDASEPTASRWASTSDERDHVYEDEYE
jgi:hypothetical protein